MNELRQRYDSLKAEQPDCPSAETIRLHREGALEGEEARRVAFHLDDCARCVGLLERLDPADPAELPEGLHREMAGEIERRLGFAAGTGAGRSRGLLGRFFHLRTPVLVPLALVVLALAWWAGGGLRPAPEAPPVIRLLTMVTVDQTLSRSTEADTTATAVAGEPFLLEVFFDRLDLQPGDRLSFAVTDAAGLVPVSGETVVLTDYNIRLALRIGQPGPCTVRLEDEEGELLEALTIRLTAAD
jgi:hypothetical protein